MPGYAAMCGDVIYGGNDIYGGRKSSMTQTDIYAVALPSVQRRTSRVGIQAHAGVLPGVSLLHLRRSPL